MKYEEIAGSEWCEEVFSETSFAKGLTDMLDAFKMTVLQGDE